MSDRENMREILDRLHKAGAAHGGCNEGEGLHGKYLVYKAKTGERVENAFVLRPDKDEAAIAALRAYAVATENKELAEDIFRWVGKGLQKPLTVDELIFFNWEIWREWWIELKSGRIFCAKECEGYIHTPKDEYSKTWRCWKEKPSDEERKAAEWL